MKVYRINDESYRLPNSLSDFQLDLYVHLINWKWSKITTDPGYYRDIPYDAIIPESFRDKHHPIYQPIVESLLAHREKYYFRLHRFVNHMASSQAACINLFLPLLKHPVIAARVLRAVKKDLREIATEYFDSGYRIEFWDDPDGSLNDHTKVSGTDSDIAIAYYDEYGDLNLWLIEHKLSEPDFTPCGGYRSQGRSKLHDCESISAILDNRELCYYHSSRNFRYWDVTLANPEIFSRDRLREYVDCPFKGGLNQLWRNLLLALSIEHSQSPNWNFKKVFFSVVYHPMNEALITTIESFRQLIRGSDHFFSFTSDQILNEAVKQKNQDIAEWLDWYRELYMINPRISG